MKKGYLAIVLHAHLPFVRHPEYSDSLEENWLFEAITESYIPLLFMMDDLVRDGIDFRITFSISPTLASMLQDSFLQTRYLKKMKTKIELGKKEIERTREQPMFNLLANRYYNRLLEIHDAFSNRYSCDLIHVFKRFQDLGKIEIMASAATHGYLPLLSMNPSTIRAQIGIGIDYYKQIFETPPKGFWLPECGYFKGVESFLKHQDIHYTILETHGITRADIRPRNGVYSPIATPSGMIAFGRDPKSSEQVWSSSEGYPGNRDYREFYRDIGYDLDMNYIGPFIQRDGIRIDTGFKYYRVTHKKNKAIYDPRKAEEKARIHARHFMASKEKQMEYLNSIMDQKPIIVAPYDAELFGHWLYEGPLWLDFLIREIHRKSETIELVTLKQYLDIYPVYQEAIPCPSSWGYKGYHDTWLNETNDWIYRDLHHGALLMEEMADHDPKTDRLRRRTLQQSARELLLAQASDWAFMIRSGGPEEYAMSRVKNHVSRLKKLNHQLKEGIIDEDWLSKIEYQDNIFPDIDYHWFKGI